MIKEILAIDAMPEGKVFKSGLIKTACINQIKKSMKPFLGRDHVAEASIDELFDILASGFIILATISSAKDKYKFLQQIIPFFEKYNISFNSSQTEDFKSIVSKLVTTKIYGIDFKKNEDVMGYLIVLMHDLKDID